MSTARLWSFLAVALPVMAALIAPLPTVDLAYHLRAGAETLTTGSIPTTDTWTFTAQGMPWLNQQWGAQIVLRITELVGGWTGLAVLRAACIGVIAAVLLSIARRGGLGPRSAALLALGAFAVASPAMALRPQLFGMVAFALVLLVLSLRAERPRLIWSVPVIVAMWANLHGSFFLGPLAVGLVWLQDVHAGGRLRHRLLGVALLSAAAACLTPFGPAVWAYAAGLSTNASVTTRLSEWQPTSLRTGPGLLFCASVAALVVLLARRSARVPWPTLAWLGMFVVVGLYTERGVAWWPLAAVPAVAPLLTSVTSASRPPRLEAPLIRRLNIVVAAAIGLVAVLLLPLWRPVDPRTRVPDGLLAYAPAGITAALRDAVVPGDRVLAEQSWASWFEYAVPTAQYAVDSRIELFSAETWVTYEGALAGVQGWEQHLDAWAIDFAVLGADQAVTASRLAAAGWRLVHADPDGVLLQRP